MPYDYDEYEDEEMMEEEMPLEEAPLQGRFAQMAPPPPEYGPMGLDDLNYEMPLNPVFEGEVNFAPGEMDMDEPMEMPEMEASPAMPDQLGMGAPAMPEQAVEPQALKATLKDMLQEKAQDRMRAADAFREKAMELTKGLK